MRLIDADKLNPDCLTKRDTLAISQSQIANAPTVSFAINSNYVTELQNLNKELIKQIEELERPQGEWIDHSEDYGYVECQVCGHLTNCEGNIDELHYCWNCGSRIGKVESDVGDKEE